MNKYRYIFLILIFLLSCPWIIIAQSREQNPADIAIDSFEEIPGRGLVIRTNPARARVFINGAERGLTPITIDTLVPGEHNVRLVRDGYIDREFPVTLFETSRLIVSIKMEKPQSTVNISVIKDPDSSEDLPFNPIVTINSLFLSNALELKDNKASITLPLGRHTIRARAKGYEDVTLTVMITDEITDVEIIQKKKE